MKENSLKVNVKEGISIKKIFIKSFFKKHFPANPLSYLGWLGYLGLLGVIFAPLIAPFILCFTFFSYRNMIADELFWKNVRSSSTKALWTVFSIDFIIMVILLIRGIINVGKGSNIPLSFVDGMVNMSVFTWEQYFITFLSFFANIGLMILVFSYNMHQFKKLEKNALEENE